ncbi:iron complex transport system ATP-binding protein [Arcanobacterium pluranimalium]|uniref:ABC transporter ATP-binding protein n=1 Tax=Arcanobacterium pluranimalium TaxID=108028 RepID=UPI00195B77C3|nr:ATP-binding cassette domain-containing protein [Arcanobacterium pluranimalium]MBM7825346.1 iron complex transport system ATP-binding protein [Arcanobacterium pluranimalium]
MGDVLEVVDASVRRGGNTILDHVQWSINETERWVVLGANGAGKTTLIQLISGRMHPTEGKVSIIGEELGKVDLSELRPLVGLLSSALDAKIPASQRVLDVVRTAAYGMTATWNESYEAEDDARARSVLGALGVENLSERKFGTLSSGEKKRVGIARALMPNPEILVLDEPASGLDLGGREKLLNSLSDLSGEMAAPVIVLVTHHVEEIPRGFTHALLLKSGKVFAAGAIDDVVTSANISEIFDVNVTVEQKNGRFTVLS